MYADVLAYDIVAQRQEQLGLDLYGIAEKCFRMISGYLELHTGTSRIAHVRGLEAGKPHIALQFNYKSWTSFLLSDTGRFQRAKLDSLWSRLAQPVGEKGPMS